jgi:hypothetical protein
VSPVSQAWNYGEVAIDPGAPIAAELVQSERDDPPDRDIPCLIPWSFILISEHVKKVVGCPYHTRPYGDLEKNTLDEIWNGPIARAMRSSLLEGKVPHFCLTFSVACPVITKRRAEGSAEVVVGRIDVGRNDGWALGDGWYGLENIPEPIRWTSGRGEFRLQTGDRNTLYIYAWLDKRDIAAAPVSGSIWRDAENIGSFNLDRAGWHELIFHMASREAGHVSNFTIAIDRSWSPAERPGNRDSRRLGIAVANIWVEASDHDVPQRIVIGENDAAAFGAGWHGVESVPELIRWTSGRSEFKLRTAGKQWVRIRAMLNKPDLASAPVSGSLWCEDARIGAFRIKRRGWHDLTFRLSQTRTDAVAKMAIVIDQPWYPAAAGLGNDRRPLGIAVRSITATD